MSLEQLATITAEMAAARSDGFVHSGTSPHSDPAAAAAAFDLTGGATNEEIDRDKARRVIVGILHRDLAYGDPVVPLEAAQRLADAFLELASALGMRFYTNGGFGDGATSFGWAPATGATFDAGVLAVGPHGSACIWVEDED